MRDAALHRITESGNFEWPWAAPTGLAIIAGAAGDSGGGGAFCLEGLNLFGAGGGGEATKLGMRETLVPMDSSFLSRCMLIWS